MQLHLVVPGLLWPRASVREVAGDLALPGLGALLGRGRVAWQPPLPFEHWLCRSFGIAAEEPPCAALRLLGEEGAPGMRAWLCADPVHLRFARDTLIVGAPGELQLSPPEAGQLVAALNAHFGELGEFFAPHPARWYLRLKHLPQIRTHPLSTVIGRPMEAFLPQGPAARDWRRILTEAQVVLHNHRLNQAREEAGQPMANSLWLWGAGTLPNLSAAPARKLYAANPMARGLARLASVPCQDVPPHADELAGVAVDGCLVLLEELNEAAHSLDMHAWRSHLAELEQRWFAPLLATLDTGKLRSLRLTALGDEGIAEIVLDSTERWKFWRRPTKLAAFARTR